MAAIDNAKEFIQEYKAKIQEIQKKIEACTPQIEYLQLEIRMLNEVEIPKAQTQAVLEGTGKSNVATLKKQLQKYQDELQEKKEEQLILSNALEQYKYQVGDEADKLRTLFTQDRQLIEKKCYANMMYAKKQYVDEILKQSVVLRELSSVDTQLQQILQDAGRQRNVYPEITIKTPFNPANKNDTGGVYLQLSFNEVKDFITGRYPESSYEYLKKFANKKDL